HIDPVYPAKVCRPCNDQFPKENHQRIQPFTTFQTTILAHHHGDAGIRRESSLHLDSPPLRVRKRQEPVVPARIHVGRKPNRAFHRLRDSRNSTQINRDHRQLSRCHCSTTSSSVNDTCLMTTDR